MPRGNREHSKVFYKGGNDDYIIFVDDLQAYKDWKNDKTIPLVNIVSGWRVFVTHQQGAQGIYDTASKAMLIEEFGTAKDEDVVRQIMEKGEIQESENTERIGVRNEMNGPRADHS